MKDLDNLDLTTLIPHRGESVLIDRVLDHDGKSTTTRVVVGSQPWLVRREGGIAPWLVVEYMAQSVATHEGLLEQVEGRPPPIGFLVSVVRLKLDLDRLRPGEELNVHTMRLRGRPELGVISHTCAVHRPGESGRPLAQGRLSIAIPRQ